MAEYDHSNDTGYYLEEEYNQMYNERTRTSPRLPICFCIDVSGSMNEKVGLLDTRIGLLSKVMKNMLRAMQNDDSPLSMEAVISVIVYDRHAHRIQPFVDIRSIDPDKATRFHAHGQTFMSEALNLALKVIDDKIQELQDNDNDNYVPMLIFMTDGEAFTCGDNPTRQFKWVCERVQKGDLHVFPIGISRDADMQVLRQIIPSSQKAYQIITAEQFSMVFDEIRKHAKRKVFVLPPDDGVDMTPAASSDEDIINSSYGSDTILDDDYWDIFK